jgi:flagellar basal-body rod protein FlgG
MPRALWTGASGMAAQQTNVDVIANNIANVNTTGFKRQKASFQDLFYEVRSAPGAPSGNSSLNPTGVQLGHGVQLTSTSRIFTEGNLEVTGGKTDMAIEGDGFFKVLLPDGSNAYTRGGDFRPDADGNLVTPDGYYLDPRITIPSDATDINISTTGVVSVIQGTAQSEIGTITLSRFQNPAGLVATGRNLFLETVASGTPEDGNPGDISFGTLRQGALENSNVEVVTELVNLIVAQRAFELNSRSISVSDQMLQTANDIARG